MLYFYMLHWSHISEKGLERFNLHLYCYDISLNDSCTLFKVYFVLMNFISFGFILFLIWFSFRFSDDRSHDYSMSPVI